MAILHYGTSMRDVERRARLYVSRGTGFWGPPMRLFAPAEITELTLRSVPEEST